MKKASAKKTVTKKTAPNKEAALKVEKVDKPTEEPKELLKTEVEIEVEIGDGVAEPEIVKDEAIETSDLKFETIATETKEPEVKVEKNEEVLGNGPTKAQKETFQKFLTNYSPPCIDENNSKLVFEGHSFLIKVNCKVRGVQNSVPKFIDGLSVVFE